MVRQAYDGIQFIIRQLENISQVLTNNARVDNTVVRAVDHLNNWTLHFQGIIDAMRASIDDLHAKVDSFLSRMDYFAQELQNNDQLFKSTVGSIHKELEKAISNQLQVDSTLQAVTNAVSGVLQGKLDIQVQDVKKIVEEAFHAADTMPAGFLNFTRFREVLERLNLPLTRRRRSSRTPSRATCC